MLSNTMYCISFIHQHNAIAEHQMKGHKVARSEHDFQDMLFQLYLQYATPCVPYVNNGVSLLQ